MAEMTPPKVVRLCEQCLRVGEDVKGRDFGPDRGSQRDPWRNQLVLCEECFGFLDRHELAMFHERYTQERTVRRDED